MKFSIYQESRRGGRKYNQDRMGYSYSRDALLLVIADGMGGHLQGEIAAQIAVEMLIRQFEAAAKPVVKEPSAFMYEAIHQAHDAILDYASKNQLLETPRTTIVTCLIQDNMAYWAHVGDSRLYFFHGGQQLHVTTDHSRVQQLLQMGKITPAQALTHPDRNKIYNCLGSAFPPEVELSPRRPIAHGDSIVLCTDGLWGTLDPMELQQYLGQFPVLYALPQLMDKAEFNGGKFGDNLTALGITWLEEDDLQQGAATSTLKMNDNDVNSQLDTIRVDENLKATGEVSDEDIETAIAEIQKAIKRYTK